MLNVTIVPGSSYFAVYWQYDGLRGYLAGHAPGAPLLRLCRDHRGRGLLLLHGHHLVPHLPGAERGIACTFTEWQMPNDPAFWQVAGVDDLFNEKMRMVVEYMQYRELSSDIKRKVGWDR